MLGVKISQILANLFSGIKIFAIVFILVIGLTMGDFINFGNQTEVLNQADRSLTQLFLLAFVGVFWSFGGWHHSTYLSGEVIKAQRTVPRAMIIGTFTVTILYLLANLAYFLLLPVDQIIASDKVAADAIGAAFSFGGSLVSIMVMCSLIGTVAIYTMTAPRIYFAMAKDGLFFKALTKVHPKYNTPYVAMIAQAVCASLFVVIWGSFVRIITFVTFMDIVFMMLAGASIFVFRKKRPNADRPYSTLAYPIIPIIYVLITFAFVVNLIFTLNTESLAGIAILAAGIPVFLYFKKHG
jgi:APA family basic amino acid/polyamine antiporter